MSLLDTGDVIVVHLSDTIQGLRGVTANLPEDVGPTLTTINTAVSVLREKLPLMRSNLTAMEVAKSGSLVYLHHAVGLSPQIIKQWTIVIHDLLYGIVSFIGAIKPYPRNCMTQAESVCM